MASAEDALDRQISKIEYAVPNPRCGKEPLLVRVEQNCNRQILDRKVRPRIVRRFNPGLEIRVVGFVDGHAVRVAAPLAPSPASGGGGSQPDPFVTKPQP